MNILNSCTRNYSVITKWGIDGYEAQCWCEETFGPGGIDPKYKWHRGFRTDREQFFFNDEKDYVWFKLRFG